MHSFYLSVFLRNVGLSMKTFGEILTSDKIFTCQGASIKWFWLQKTWPNILWTYAQKNSEKFEERKWRWRESVIAALSVIHEKLVKSTSFRSCQSEGANLHSIRHSGPFWSTTGCCLPRFSVQYLPSPVRWG